MNKGEFTVALAERCELSKAEAGRALEAILDTLTDSMAEHDEVTLTGWGKFSAQRRKGRDASDPRDPRRTIHIAPTYAPKFKAGSVLKREIQLAFEDDDSTDDRPSQDTRAPAQSAENGSVARPTAKRGEWRPLAQR